MKKPKVSIITITYNRSEFISQAIESVLAQGFIDFEYIILDDASNDNTSAIVKEFSKNDSRIKYHRNDSNLGISKARNKAMSLSTGDYIAILDSDDVWFDGNKLLKQINFFEKNKECVLLGTQVNTIDKDGKLLSKYEYPLSDVEIRKGILWRNPFINSSTVFLKDIATSCEGYDEGLVIGEEYDLWLKMGLKGGMFNLSDYCVNYRIHGSNESVLKRWRGAVDTYKIIKRYKYKYPRYPLSLLKAYARIIYSLHLMLVDKIKYCK